LDIPARRQRAHAQVQDQPAGEQHVHALAVDQRRGQHEQGQHDHAAVQQARFAVILLDRQDQLFGRPLHGGQARRAHEGGAAHDPGRHFLQAQAEASLDGRQRALMRVARGPAQQLEGIGVPAGYVHGMA
jgi:hypothetical protein